MDIQKFIALREYLYHLTDEKNLKYILGQRRLDSTAILAKKANIPNLDKFLHTRRIGHKLVSNQEFEALLRDQDPLFQKIVEKNLTDGWSFEDFVFSLNSRVFFWSTEKDLRTHYQRYENQNEYPKILRLKTSDVFAANKSEPQFCHLNSGAPRCSAYHKKGAPPRGPETFLPAHKYTRTPSSVREITFLYSCVLPADIWVSNHPDNQFKKVTK